MRVWFFLSLEFNFTIKFNWIIILTFLKLQPSDIVFLMGKISKRIIFYFKLIIFSPIYLSKLTNGSFLIKKISFDYFFMHSRIVLCSGTLLLWTFTKHVKFEMIKLSSNILAWSVLIWTEIINLFYWPYWINWINLASQKCMKIEYFFLI